MTRGWDDLLRGERWRSPDTLWVEDGTEHGWAAVDELAAAVEAAIRACGPGRVVRIRSGSKLGCFAGQLGAWRAGRVVVADHGDLGPGELDLVRPDLTLDVTPGRAEPAVPAVPAGPVGGPDRPLPADRIPGSVVTVNFTSGSTGSRKAVAVTRGNLLALFGCRGLDVPAPGGLTAGSFATPAYDGWWFDTWRTVAAGGTVVCLPGVNEDVFAWPELAGTYGIDRLLLPTAVVAALVDAVPDCLTGIPWLFSGGEQFQVSTYRRAREAGLTNRFVNLYGPTEATFATHKHELPTDLAADVVPIGAPLDGCAQRLDGGELVVSGPLVCLGYLAGGAVAEEFRGEFRTGDLVRADPAGDLVFAGRLDSRIKVNGLRVDAAALEHRVATLPAVADCRVVQDERLTVAFVRTPAGASADPAVRDRVESVVRTFSPAIGVRLLDRFPVKAGGKVDAAALMDQHRATDRDEEQ